MHNHLTPNIAVDYPGYPDFAHFSFILFLKISPSAFGGICNSLLFYVTMFLLIPIEPNE